MFPNVELPIQPNTVNCLTWSEDGELAIAAGEFVHILASQVFAGIKLVLIGSRYPVGVERKNKFQILGSMFNSG